MKNLIFILLLTLTIFPQEMELIGVRGGYISSKEQIAIAGSHLYISTGELGFFYTNDTTILRVIKVPMSSDANYLSTSQIDTNLLFFNSAGTHLKTNSAGLDWDILHRNSGLNGSNSYNIINPQNPFIVYSIRNGNEIWKSFDKGDTWSLIHKFRVKVFALEIAPSDTNFIYCSADNSIYLSTNAGSNWTKKLMDTTHSVYKIAVNPLNKNSIYFDRTSKFYKSVSNGSDPIVCKTSLYLNDICINYADTNVIYIAGISAPSYSFTGIFKSTDDGKSWIMPSNGFPAHYDCNNIEIDRKNPSILYAGLIGFGVFKSNNSGESWFPTNLSYTHNSDIHFFSKDSFMVTSHGWGIWKTNNRAAEWYQPVLNTDFQTGGSSLISFSPHKKNIGLCGSGGGYPLRTTDFGETWDTLSLGINSFGGSFVYFNEFIPGLVFLTGINDVGFGPNFTARSSDYGETWEMLSNESYGRIFTDLIDSALVYSIENDQLHKSTNYGADWQLVKEFDYYITNIQVSKTGTFYAISPFGDSGPGALMMSTDKGVTWIHIDQKLALLDPTMRVMEVWVDPIKTGRLYISLDSQFEPFTPQYTNGGLYLTEDNGQNWRKVYDARVYSIGKDPDTPGYMYIGTQYGIMRFIDTLTVSDVNELQVNIPDSYNLLQNYPNPFNPVATIQYSIPESGKISIKVYNTLGKEIATLINEEKQAGTYRVNFDASHLPSGVYFYRIRAGKFSETKKMIFLK